MKLTISLLLLAIALLAGCAAATVQSAEEAVSSLLVVDNQRTADEWIYLEHDGAKGKKLGRVSALTTDTLLLRASDLAGDQLQFVAIAFASGAADQSDPIIAERGVVYHWQLAPMRGATFLSSGRAE